MLVYFYRALLDLRTLESEKLHDLWLDITGEEGEPFGSVHMSVMVSGKKLMSESIPVEEAANYSQHNEVRAPTSMDRYSLRNALKDTVDVGTVTVKVFRGQYAPQKRIYRLGFLSRPLTSCSGLCTLIVTVDKWHKLSASVRCVQVSISIIPFFVPAITYLYREIVFAKYVHNNIISYCWKVCSLRS